MAAAPARSGTDPRKVYDRLHRLGKGNFATVYAGKRIDSGAPVAIKVVDLERTHAKLEDIEHEVNILAQCKSPFVTQLFGSYMQGRRLWIVMELMGVGSVSEVIKSQGAFHEEAVAAVLYGATEGLAYLHSHGHTHCDVKTANILLAPSGAVKLCDLGVALSVTKTAATRFHEDQQAQGGASASDQKPSYRDWFPASGTKASAAKSSEKKDADFAGTPFYMAPEVISMEGMTPKSDIWSLGIVAMELALGKCPRSDSHPLKVMQMVVREPAPKLVGKFNSKLVEFCDMCLQKTPATRADSGALLKHKFIKGVTKSKKLNEIISKHIAWKEKREDSSGTSDPASDTNEGQGWDY